MANLSEGQEIKTKESKTIVIGRKLGEGGQGAVYEVDYNGKKKALKWYSGKKITNPEKFYANLENNIKKGKPGESFIWPEAITEKLGDSFGYVMDLITSEYKDLSRIIIGREKFGSVGAMSNASLQIAAAIYALHNKGYVFQDLSDGNILINPQNGNVLICDNDNVSAYGKASGIAGKARYMAPEIVTEGKDPDEQTDAFSLAVILYFLWTNNHPLEGKAACPPYMDAKAERRIYGESPVFVWDPSDNSNRPVQNIHMGSINKWPILPKYLQEAFIKAFSKEALHDPQKRLQEREWVKIFNRMIEEKFEG